MDSNPIQQWLRQQCTDWLLNEKWLLVDELRIGQLWRDRLVRSGTSHVNLHIKSLRSLAQELARPSLAVQRLEIASVDSQRLLLSWLLRQLIDQGRLHYFAEVQNIDSLSRLLLRTLEDLALANVKLEDSRAECFESAAKAHDLAIISSDYRQLLAQHRLADYAECVHLATRGLNTGSIALPRDLRILLPEQLCFSLLEQRMLDSLAALVPVQAPLSSPISPSIETTASSVSVQAVRALGEVNEVRGAFQHLLANPSARLDTAELLVTDYETYAPLVLEVASKWFSNSPRQADATSQPGLSLSSLDQLPITFAEGVACVYARPGRLLRSWIRWSQSDYLQSRLVDMIREGLLVRPPGVESVGYGRLASGLRRIPIGFGIDRYLSQIDREIAKARQELAEFRRYISRRDGVSESEVKHDFGMPVLTALRDWLEQLLPLAPNRHQTPSQTLELSLRLLKQHARADSALDRYARGRMCEEIERMQSTLSRFPQIELDIHGWLEELASRCRILASAPCPGAIHLAPLEHGGASGRPISLLVGMDESRFPKTVGADPLLLDNERSGLNSDLPTSLVRARRHQQLIHRLLDRKRGVQNAQLLITYSQRHLQDDSESFPSPSITEAYQLVDEKISPTAHQSICALLPLLSFVNNQPALSIDATEAWLAALLKAESPLVRRDLIRHAFPMAMMREAALASLATARFTAFDGWVPAAGLEQLQRMQREQVSASRLEMLGTCPRKFFFQRVLGIYPPEEYQMDHTRWLSPLAIGNLMHELFEQFLRDLIERQQLPNVQRDLADLKARLLSRVSQLKNELPIPNQDAFERQLGELLDACEIFLEQESIYYAQRHAKPWALEAAIGPTGIQPRDATKTSPIDSPIPAPLVLSHGAALQLVGRMDRVDTIEEGNEQRFVIWDYKTGGDYGYDINDPFAAGRKLQPYLYVSMLRQRLAELEQANAHVAAFGYFFPSSRTEGRRLEWNAEELDRGRTIVEHLLELLRCGGFIATTEAADCEICDYASVCGDPQPLVTISNIKTENTDNAQLSAWRQLRHG